MDPLVDAEPLDGDQGTSAPPVEGVRVRTEIGARHGVDLTTVPVDRTAEGASETHRLGARAYTSDRAVVIPASAGSLEAGPGEALLAHELTHVAQRARFGPALPAEHTPAGRLLEAEALTTETTYRLGPVLDRCPRPRLAEAGHRGPPGSDRTEAPAPR